MKFLAGKKVFITMGVALAAALYSHFVEPIPVVDSDLWAISVPLVAIALRFVTHKKISFMELLQAAKAIDDARKNFNDTANEDNDPRNRN